MVSVENSERPEDPNRLEIKNPHEGGQNRPLQKADVIPCELLDGIDWIALNPDEVHARGALALVNLYITGARPQNH